MRKFLTAVVMAFLCVGLSAQHLADTLSQMTGFAPVGGNQVFFTKNGEEYLDLLLSDMRSAQKSINLEFYWFDTDEVGRAVRDLLVCKAEEGVKVRVLMDNLVTPLATELFYQKMRDAGVEVRYAHDFEKLSVGKSLKTVFLERDHRKICIIDGSVGYTGGINLCHPAIYEWQDLGVRVEGPVAASLEKFFVQGWVYSGGKPFEVEVPEGEGPVLAQVIPGWADGQIEDIYILALNAAKEYFYIQTPYYIPPQAVLEAMKEAARRGVDVRMLLEKSDHAYMDELARDYYEELLEAGVKIAVRQGIFDHSKVFVSDHYLASCGTLNMDKRSFNINLENLIFFYDKEQADALTQLFLDLEADARPAQPGEQVVHGFRKAWRGFLHWVSPLL